MRFRTFALVMLASVLLVPEGAFAAQIIVKRQPGLSAAEHADLRADAGVRHLRSLRLERTEVVSAPAGETDAALRELRADPDVVYAELDRPVHAFTTDPYYPEQWALENLGQTGGTVDADMDVPEAWALTTGAAQRVAVVDTGVNDSHPDLAGRVDVPAGYDWVGDDPDNPNDDDQDPDDEQGHGTHVSGIVAATPNNGVGIAGVAPGATIVPLRVLGPDGSGWVSDVVDALDYAGDNNVRIVNLSLGAEGASMSERNAIASHPGTLYVVAAGNGGADGVGDDNDGTAPDYPCSYDLANILCVGATDDRDQRGSFSNYGATTVDVFAPGVDIRSTWLFSGYRLSDGTSMATPHVAATAALVWQANPALSATGVKAAITSGVESRSSLCGWSATGGRVNARTAVDIARGGAAPAHDCDGDGVVDAADVCRTVPGNGANGCPGNQPPVVTPTPTPSPVPVADRDGDGRGDASDSCPDERAATADGCPVPAFASLSKKVRHCAGRRQCVRQVRVTVRADRAATATVTVQRKRCRKGSCRWVRVARRTEAAPNGTASVTVKRLRRGAHRVIARLSSSAGTSPARTLGFRVR